ncbi:hypothetical protein ACHHYP_14543 [Achlya hypogyna]|uniref:FYVE-type domain-containing protein n=1 Tax=Achlya hypogyna TaxID=1202772 RepID=A0A1V9YCW7_ACHHY|nr:hypothetical protein ACHHYP_14543 [Achlya hypogyna]
MVPTFETPPLPVSVVDHIKRTGLAACHAVLRNLDLDEAPLYAKYLEATSLRRMELRKGADATESARTCILGRTTLSASLDEIAVHLPASKGAYMWGIAPEHQHLYRLAAPTRDKPWQSTLVHWFGVDGRDFCVVETQLGFTTATAARGLVRVLQSLDLPTVCPPLDPAYKYARSTLEPCGHVFVEELPTKARAAMATVFAVVTLPSSAPTLADLADARQRVTAIMSLAAHFQTQRLTKAAVALVNWRRSPNYDVAWVEAKKPAKLCAICSGRFHLFRPKVHCELDGRVVCCGCSAKWCLLPGAASPISVRICNDCVQGAVRGNLTVGPKATTTDASNRAVQTLSSLLGSRQDGSARTNPPRVASEYTE